MDKLRENLEILYRENAKNADFFDKNGIKKESFRKYFTESGNPSVKAVIQIATATNVSFAWLFGEIEERSISEHTANQGVSDREYQLLEENVSLLKERIKDKEKIISSNEALIETQKKRIDDMERENEKLRLMLAQQSSGMPTTAADPLTQSMRQNTVIQKNIDSNRQ